MNDQNNNINQAPQQTNGTQVPVQPVNPQQATIQQTPVQPAQPVAPTPVPVQSAPIPQTPVQTFTPVQPTTVEVQQPVQGPVVTESVPIQQHAPQPQSSSTPVAPIPTPRVEQNVVPTQQPVTPIVETPVQQSTVAQPVQQPVQSVPVQQPVVTQAEPVVVPQQHGTQEFSSPSINTTPSNGVFGPSTPLTGNDATNIGFVAASAEMPKKKNKGLTFAIILIVLVILGLVGYFIVYPFIMKTYFNDPKNVYETSIKSAFKGIGTTANDFVHNKAIYDIEATFDSNIESLKDYTGYTYSINFGVDPEKKTLQEGLTIKELASNVEHSYFYYVKNNTAYERYSGYRGYIRRGEIDPEATNDLFKLFSNEDIFETSDKLSSEDINYLVDKLSQLIVDSIDEEKLTKEDTSITINGKTLKVTANNYVINNETAKKMTESVINGLKSDDKTIEILSKYLEITKDEVKVAIDEIKLNDVEDNNKTITTSIYTYGTKNEIVGFSVVDSEEESRLHYYFNDEYKEIKLNTKTKNEDTGKIEENNYEVISKKEENNTKVTVKADDDEILVLDVKQWDENGINFDYTLNIEEDSFTGSFKYTKDVNDERVKVSVEASVRMGKEYISIAVDFSEDWSSEVANINTDTATQLSAEELEKQQKEFMDALLNTPIGKLYKSVSGDYDNSIKDYYDNNDDFNMIQPVPDNGTDIEF